MENKKTFEETISYLQSISNKELVINEKELDIAFQKNNSKEQTILIKILTIIGALLTCGCCVAFTLIIGVYNNAILMTVLGVSLIIGSSYLSLKTHEIFLDTFILSLYCVGFGFLGFGLNQQNLDIKIILILFIVISTLILFYLENYIIIFISTLILFGSTKFLIELYQLPTLYTLFISTISVATVLMLLKEANIISYSKHLARVYDPIKIAFLLSFIILINDTKIPLYNNFADTDPTFYNSLIINTIIISIVILGLFLYTESQALAKLQINNKKDKVLIYAMTFIVLLPTLIQPSIAGSLLVIILCFMINYKTGFVLGVLSFLYYIIRFYYDMNISLLNKSIALILSGILFFVVYYFYAKNLSRHEKN